ncbi:hypothetical protein DEJ50_05630 [Streptomyces venezuelae]|uniref:Sugar-binding protein n=1 Tax=Streptomyces venezuelae TaxID=54571 RepID=A0A5P2CWV6_STRVZ|nr:ricin-type beta-trefoil lectin domain protein [Streptomyces venezuelae]QES47382.1 hypothetical protein DEJ50_05630 [Streptomyces venezuelae]
MPNRVKSATSTSFTPATGPAFTTTVTNAAGHTTTTKSDPGRGSALETTDANGRTVTTEYDHLGRSVKVWTPSQKPATDDPAYRFGYQIEAEKPPAVTSSVLRDNGTYEDSIAIYDGLLRPLQTQKEGVGGGRIVSDFFYNQDGSTRRTNNGYHAEGEPRAEIFVYRSDFSVPNSTQTAYDGLGRPVRVTTFHRDTAKYSSTNQYGGDWTVARTGMSASGLAPVPGSRAVKTWTDALGRTSKIQHYTATDLTTANDTGYAYDLRGKLIKVTDAAGNDWTYTYDARGRKKTSTDPDMGRSEFAYNELDQLTWTRDETGRAQHHTYDVLGRKVALRDDAWNGKLVAAWTFDTLPGAKGHPVASTRYDDNGKAFTSEVTGYDTEYRPTGSKITIPDTPATKGLAGSYAYSTGYTRTGKVQSTTLPATPGGLAAERLVTRYDGEGSPLTLSGLSWYTADTVYSPFGEVLRTASGNAPERVWTTNFHDPSTGRLTTSYTDRETAPHRISELNYAYDHVGNITSVTDRRPGDTPDRTDRQCYAYDPMGQLRKAWTGRTDCSAPSTSTVTAGRDGDGFWHEYEFDKIGNRTKLTDKDLTSEALDDTYDYEYGVTVTNNGTQATTRTQPHALTTVKTTTRKPGSTVESVSTYGYDSVGNTTRRTIGGDTQNLTWDRRNKLTSADSPGIGAFPVIGLSGKCLDVQSGATADGTPVQLHTCNDTKAQQWRLTGETLQVLGKCATSTGGAVTLSACNGGSSQKFVHRTGDKTLHHPATGTCVEVPGANPTDGTDLTLAPCTAGAAQQWNLTDTTTYLYDASGNRLIEDTGATRTLYLGESEITVDASGKAIDARRYYASPGAPTTVRHTFGKTIAHSLSLLLTDHHNTATTSIDQGPGQPVSHRKSDPYGNPRGTQPTGWPSDHTFLGVGIDDTTTGLTHIGAREYDPTTGRFISVDPLIDIADPLQMNGYTYANGNPITNWDPTGLINAAMGGDGKNKPARGYVEKFDQHIVNSVEKMTGDDYDKDGRVYVFPTVTVSTKWPKKHRVAFAKNFYNEIDRLCTGGYSESCFSDKSHITNLQTVNHAVASACYDTVGPNCPADLKYNVAKMISLGGGVAFSEGGGEGGQFTGPRAPWIGARKGDCGRNSFVAGTEVLLADGTHKPIEELRVGDEVIATDPESGETTAEAVTAEIYTQDDKTYVDVSVETADGVKVVTTTGHHPFWSESEHAWLDAADLKAGMTLRTDEGATAPIAAVRTYQATLDTYNLTVADLHTYYVLAGVTPVLVHNCGGGVDANGSPCSCSGPPPYGSGSAYTVGYQMELPSTSYPKKPRSLHFQDANRSLYAAMQQDATFAASMESMIPGITKFLTPGPRGGMTSATPASLGWTWHHATDAGVMQLVPRSQHRYGGQLQGALHPGGVGGFKIWG